MGDNENVYSVRFIAKDESTGYFCIFCAIFDSNIGKIDLFETLITNQTTFPKINNNSTFKDFSNAIQATKYKGEFSQNYTTSLSENYRFTFSTENFIEELRHYLEHNDTDKIIYLFQQSLLQVLGTSAKLEMNLYLDQINKKDIEKVSESEQNETTDQVASFIPAGSMVVNYKFALSPVSGVKLSDLKEGSRIMIKVIAGDPNSNNAINLLKLKDDSGNIKIIPATIVYIHHNPKATETIIKITDSIFGKYVEEEPSIKVKLAGNETLASVTSSQGERKAQGIPPKQHAIVESSSMPITILVSIGLLGLIGAFVVIFLL